MQSGCRAAVEVFEELGHRSDAPEVIQETHNTVVWLRPHPVIAKVATRRDDAVDLVREHRVVSALDRLGAGVAPPAPGVAPIRHSPSGYVVTFWRRLDHDPHADAPAALVGDSLADLHVALSRCEVELPSFRAGLQRARRALSNDGLMRALDAPDRAFLRSAFDSLMAELDRRHFATQNLHGEPHDGNRLLTPDGLRWIDFEAACRGPLEWDLAFISDDACAAFAHADLELLALLRTLNRARVATWCWLRAQFPEMRWHGQHHLRVVRNSWHPA
jgi:hypothetical protein